MQKKANIIYPDWKRMLGRVLILAIFLPHMVLVADKPDWPGIWAIWSGEDVSNADKPWYKGALLATSWKEVQPEQDQWDFSDIDRRVAEAVGNGLYVGLIFYIDGPADWIYEAGVPKVRLNKAFWKADKGEYPFSVHPVYQQLLAEFIERVAEHVKHYPPGIRERIVFVQCPTGKSGDPSPYAGWLGGKANPVDPEFQIGVEEWEQHTRGVLQRYVDAYADADPPIAVLFNLSEDAFNYFEDRVSHLFIKTMNVAQGHGLRNEFTGDDWDNDAVSRFHDGRAIRGRGEFAHGPNHEIEWFLEAPVWNTYWQALWLLTYGTDIMNMRSEHLHGKNAEQHVQAYEFFSRYAGLKDARDSSGAWCAFRDGLDAADVERFPEEEFGLVEKGWNLGRFKSIVASHAAQGAQIGDPEALLHRGDVTKVQKALNDTNFNIWRGNYRMFLHQIEPDVTSVGYWRVGEKSQPFGRFARGFQHRSGRDWMGFDIEDGFFHDAPLAGAYPVEVRVVYYDQGTGTWALRYDAQDGPGKTAIEVKKTNTGRWKQVNVRIGDGHFGNRGKSGADLELLNTDAEDDVFHLIEITRETGDRKGHWGIPEKGN